mmetsp:Transcript_11281/g.16581  ORF Transcript_11281/g.16581 Transcript_11281/m.16581 type:complete len:492 (+) Transcript_11281:71-1546(+)
MPSNATTNHIDSNLASKAVKALLDYHDDSNKDVNSLLGNDKLVQVQFALEKVPTNPSPKPKCMTIPHAMWKTCDADDDGLEDPNVCLIVKEDSKQWVKDLIDEFPKEMVFVKKVLGLDSLRKKHAKFEQQRALLARFDIFMADDRILPMVGKAIGKHFFSAKKQPIPVRLTRKATLPLQIVHSLRATYWYLSEGTCLSVKAGTTAMSPEHLIGNIVHIATQLPEKLPRKWANIRSISVKTSDSVSLPFYNKTPAELNEIAKLAGLEEKFVDMKKKRTEDIASKNGDQETSMISQKKRKKKSPLLRALKMQEEQNQKNERENEKSSKRQKTNPKEKARKQTAHETASDDEKEHKAESSTPSKSTAGSKSKSVSSTKKRKINSNLSVKEQENSEKQEKKQLPNNFKKPTVKASTNKSSSEQVETSKKPFIPEKKFRGSREGYVFRMGAKGLGYYVDVKPVVDPMLLEAIDRMSKRPKSVQKKKKKKSNRRKSW